MKIKLLFLLIFPFTVLAQDTYFVAHIEGKISREKNKTIIDVGDSVNTNEKFYFSSPKDFFTVIGERGSHSIRYRETAGSVRGNIFLVAVADAIFPTVKKKFTQTRSGVIRSEDDLILYLSVFNTPENRLIIVDSLRVPIQQSAFQFDERHFFFISYNFHDEKINKRLSQVFIDREVFKVDGNLIDPLKIDSLELNYRNEVAGESTKISTFSVKYMELKNIVSQLKKELPVYKQFNPAMSCDEAVSNHLKEDYGNIEKTTGERIAKILCDK